MYKHILIATDGSELAAKAVTAGLSLAKALGARVTAINVSEPWTSMVGAEGTTFSFPINEYEKATGDAAASIFEEVRKEASRLGVQYKTIHVQGFPAEAIIETAQTQGCDLIVVASHGRRGIARALLGSQAARVVTLSAVPVLICR